MLLPNRGAHRIFARNVGATLVVALSNTRFAKIARAPPNRFYTKLGRLIEGKTERCNILHPSVSALMSKLTQWQLWQWMRHDYATFCNLSIFQSPLLSLIRNALSRIVCPALLPRVRIAVAVPST